MKTYPYMVTSSRRSTGLCTAAAWWALAHTRNTAAPVRQSRGPQCDGGECGGGHEYTEQVELRTTPKTRAVLEFMARATTTFEEGGGDQIIPTMMPGMKEAHKKKGYLVGIGIPIHGSFKPP